MVLLLLLLLLPLLALLLLLLLLALLLVLLLLLLLTPPSLVQVGAFNNVFQNNLVAGCLEPCQIFGAGMVARKKGSIINIASVTSHVPLSKVVAYSASKAAVVSLSQWLAREWAPHGVRVNTITPGFFPAAQNMALLFKTVPTEADPKGEPTERGGKILDHTMFGRFGKAEEIVGTAVFLGSQAASGFITGTDIRVDGGFLSQTL